MGILICVAVRPEALVPITANERGELNGELRDQHELVDTVTDFAREIKETKGLVVLCSSVRILTDSRMARRLTRSSVASHLGIASSSEMASLFMSI